VVDVGAYDAMGLDVVEKVCCRSEVVDGGAYD
jgi:hypothetical protein